MNSNKKVLTLILVVTIIQLSLSIFSKEIVDFFPYFKNVNLIYDIIQKDKPLQDLQHKKNTFLPKKIDGIVVNDFNQYTKKGTLVHFNTDTLQPALSRFNEKLIALAEGKNVKIRIAWFGDSQIEGDFITQDVRKLLQNYFETQRGVGFVPITSVASDFRSTAKLVVSGDVKSENFKTSNLKSNLFFSGYSFFSNDLSIDFVDGSAKNQATQKWLLYGKGDSISVTIRDSIRKYPANKNINRILIHNTTVNKTKFSVKSNSTPLYGISSEPQSGIVLDNFSFRGITGVEMKKLNNELLAEINNSNYYDLIVFQYGVNLMFKPNDTNYDYYYRGMRSVLKKFKTNMPNTDFLLFSCSDKAFNYDGEWKTAIGIDSLISIQARLAHNYDIPFYNFYNSMGGNGTIVKWADSTPQLANKDYVHFNYKGAKEAAKIIFNALIHDYQKAVEWKKSNKPILPAKSITIKALERKPIQKETIYSKPIVPTINKIDSSKSKVEKEVASKTTIKNTDSI